MLTPSKPGQGEGGREFRERREERAEGEQTRGGESTGEERGGEERGGGGERRRRRLCSVVFKHDLKELLPKPSNPKPPSLEPYTL